MVVGVNVLVCDDGDGALAYLEEDAAVVDVQAWHVKDAVDSSEHSIHHVN